MPYSDWVQDDDFYGGVGYDPDTHIQVEEGVDTYAERSLEWVQAPMYVIEAGDFETVENDAATSAYMAGAGLTNAIHVTWGYDNTGGIFDPWESTVRATQNFSPCAISPFSFGANAYSPNIWAGPGNAIGWQWQDDMSVGGFKRAPVASAMIASGNVVGGFVDGTDATHKESFTTHLMVGEGAWLSDTNPSPDDGWDVITAWSGPDDGSVLHDVVAASVPASTVSLPDLDLTPHLDAQGRVVLYARTNSTKVPTVRDDITNDSNELDYGYRIGVVSVDWWFHPPVFRWILEGGGRPARLYPTDHAKRNTPRIFPPSRSRHGGHKPTGYL